MNWINYTCLAFLCFVCLLKGNTQTLHGQIFTDDGKPLAGAFIGVPGTAIATTSNSSGAYELQLKPDEPTRIQASFLGFDTVSWEVSLQAGQRLRKDITLRLSARNLTQFEVSGRRNQSPGIQTIDPKAVSALPTPNASLEKALAFQSLGVYSTNELSSQYNVRGGNFDENLVYVNDVAIYRPFLVRSGQQEGLSFINPNMVESVQFSSGGFDAKYGDKMSSVLDVKYKEPREKLSGAVEGSLLGASVYLGNASEGGRFTQIHGFRYRTNQYLLDALDTEGDYQPVFTDYQGYFTYDINDEVELGLLATYSNNLYRFVPQTRQTEFGTVNEALRLTIFFDGQEITQFENGLGSFSVTYRPTSKLKLKFIGSIWRSLEYEGFDVAGAYRLDELERDLGSDNFGDVAFNRGVGGFLNHARNELDVLVFSEEHKGSYFGDNVLWEWGLKHQQEQIVDELNEWRMLDSAGYSVPRQPGDQIELYEVIRANNDITSNRLMGYLQGSKEWLIDSTEISLHAGARFHYWDFNEQLVGGPRVALSVKPNWRRNYKFRAAWGYYHQPAFYREMRNLNGAVNRDIKAQTSIHYLVGMDYQFNMWDRPFKFTSEAYYKQLQNIIPYEVDNVRLRYYATNNSAGYAAGIDFKINGEFVKGVESWASVSFMKTEENLNNDFFYRRFNAAGEEIVPGFSLDQVATDSTRVSPGFVPRPTDQRFNFSLFFQDYLPGNETVRMNLSFLYATGLPFGPPTFDRYKDTLRIPAYRRVDLGLSKQLLRDKDDEKRDGLGNRGVFRHIDNIWLSLEVFNLLQVNNTISYLWIRDISNRTYAVPNFLTSRRVNLKLQIAF